MDSIGKFSNDKVEMVRIKDFQEKTEEHLGRYKKNYLYISEQGEYKHNGKVYKYNHILPNKKAEFNILEGYREQFLKSEHKKDITLHKFFHHLNSSQAMCINFFYPLIKEKLLDLILSIMKIEGNPIYLLDHLGFEKKSPIENGRYRRTNFDFYIKLATEKELFFEIKYTENGFGRATKDQEHKEKYKNIYWPILQDHLAIKNEYKNEDYFLNHYQLMRNLIHINKNSYVIFIYPKSNKVVRKAALLAQTELLEDKWKQHLVLITWEELVEQLMLRIGSEALITYYKDFYNKYLNYYRVEELI